DPCAGYSRNETDQAFPSGNGDTFNGVDFRDTLCGNDLGQGVAAVTLIRSRGSLQGFPGIVETDILFNASYDWDVFSGVRPGVDFRRAALHELGHALGLDHEENELSIMAPNMSSVDKLQADDILGANTLYGGPGDCDIRD